MNKTNHLFVSSSSFVVMGLIILGLIVAALIVVGLPTATHAASYVYVNASGEVTGVVANTSSGAFTNSTDIALHSGVMLVDGVADSNLVGDQSQSPGYGYVNDSGEVMKSVSGTVSGAFANSIDIADHSGVILLNSSDDVGLVGDKVAGV